MQTPPMWVAMLRNRVGGQVFFCLFLGDGSTFKGIARYYLPRASRGKLLLAGAKYVCPFLFAKIQLFLSAVFLFSFLWSLL